MCTVLEGVHEQQGEWDFFQLIFQSFLSVRTCLLLFLCFSRLQSLVSSFQILTNSWINLWNSWIKVIRVKSMQGFYTLFFSFSALMIWNDSKSSLMLEVEITLGCWFLHSFSWSCRWCTFWKHEECFAVLNRACVKCCCFPTLLFEFGIIMFSRNLTFYVRYFF